LILRERLITLIKHILQYVTNMKESKVYIETYGCQMNLSDSEIIAGIMKANGYEIVTTLEEANVILFNTCSVREHAEERVIQRIRSIKKIKQNNKSYCF